MFIRWLRKVEIWKIRVKPYMSVKEQALALLEEIGGEAADILEPILDEHGPTYYATDDGIDRIIADVRPAYAEKAFVRKQQVLQQYESIRRRQGESLVSYITRFKTMEATVRGAGIKQLQDEESRAFRFIRTAAIEARTRNVILGTAGHVWNFERICDAIKTLYPGGASLFNEPTEKTLGINRAGKKRSGEGKR